MPLKRWDIVCSVHGHIEVTSETEPTECPQNAEDIIGEVTYLGGKPELVLTSPNGTKYDIQVTDGGAMNPVEIT